MGRRCTSDAQLVPADNHTLHRLIFNVCQALLAAHADMHGDHASAEVVNVHVTEAG